MGPKYWKEGTKIKEYFGNYFCSISEIWMDKELTNKLKYLRTFLRFLKGADQVKNN